MIAKTQVAGEYWYFDAQNCEKQKEQLILKAANADLQTLKWIDKFKLQEQKTEAVKPSWLQHPITITVIAGLAFLGGVAIGGVF